MNTQDKQIKVLFFLNILRKGAGMINREAAFAEELNKAGFKVSILSYFKPVMKMNDDIRVNCVYPTRYIEKLYSHTLGRALAFLKILLVFAIRQPDVVLVDLPSEARWAIVFRKLFKYKVIFNYHGVADEKFYKGREAEKLIKLRKDGHAMLKKADLVLAVSDFLLDELNEIGVKADRLYNGINESQFYIDRAIKKDPNKILFIGRFTEYKGAFNIVQSFSIIAQDFPELKLELYGYLESEKYLAKIREYLQRKQLANRVTLQGPINQNQMRIAMSEAGIFINGSTDETFCMPLLEAQACGTPCVAFSAGGIPEVLADGKTGLLAQANNVKDMSQKIKTLVSDKAFYELCKFNTRTHTNKFKYSKLVRELATHIQNLSLKNGVQQ
ncbi:MAG: glycosyltransferase family 4 protein [Lentisphaeraceae bacterium]|nr:glycosyltransferase family 4 protein [Lentisphaeraceae bacterium]